MYTLLCHQLSASILSIVARLLEKVMSIDWWCVVCGAWFYPNAMCVQLLLQFKCIDRFELTIAYRSYRCASGLYAIFSHIDFSHFFSRDQRLLPMSHDIDCWYLHGILI